MIEALLSLSLSCSDARQIVSRMMKLEYMTYQEKVEVARELERSIPNCHIDIKTK